MLGLRRHGLRQGETTHTTRPKNSTRPAVINALARAEWFCRMVDNIKNAPCVMCTRVTRHHVLARQNRSDEDVSDNYYFLECAGCGAVSMANLWNSGGEDEARYYPSPISRKPPDWLWKLRFLFATDEKPLGELPSSRSVGSRPSGAVTSICPLPVSSVIVRMIPISIE